MKKLFFLFLIFSSTLFSQVNKGSCKVGKATPDPSQKPKVTFKFISPIGKPVTSHLTFRINNDSLVQPKIDKTGTYVMTIDPGVYSFSFYVQYWAEVFSKPLTLKAKTNTPVTVKFEAEEIRVNKK